MGFRLSKIYTRTGDDGTTGLADGSRVEKTSMRVETMGTVDELNCQLGVVIAHLASTHPVRLILESIQHQLFELGSELAIPGSAYIQDAHVSWLEEHLDTLNQHLPPLKDFILPGGAPSAAHCHLARAICRRAERIAVAQGQEDGMRPHLKRYLNRLSDFLFVSARVLARENEGVEVLWKPARKA